jgi:hypothetical protein
LPVPDWDAEARLGVGSFRGYLSLELRLYCLDMRVQTIQRYAMSDPVTNNERMKAEVESKDLADASQIFADGETTPLPTGTLPSRTGMLDRVADSGDLGEGSPSPYGLAIQAEIIAQQTERRGTTQSEEITKATKS